MDKIDMWVGIQDKEWKVNNNPKGTNLADQVFQTLQRTINKALAANRSGFNEQGPA